MKRWLWIAAVLAVAGANAQKMTMEEAVAIAKANAFEVQLAKQDAKRAAAVVAEANSTGIPKINFGTTYTRYTDELSAQLSPPPDPPTIVRPIDRTVFQLTLNQYLDIAGIARLALAGARALQAASDSLVIAAVNDAGLKAKVAFLAVGRAMQLKDVADERAKDAQSQLDIANKRYEAGTAPKFDVIRFQADQASAQQDVLQTSNGIDLAKAQFNQALARDVSTPVDLEFPAGLPSVSKNFDELNKTAEEKRPDVAAAAKRLEYQTNYRRGKQRENYPTINLAGTWSYDPNAQGFAAQKSVTFGTLTLNVPLWDAGVTRARVRQAAADEERARIALEQTKSIGSLEVKQAYLRVTSTKEQIDVAKKTVDSATEALRLANVRYEAGVGTPLEISDATVQFVRAKQSYVNAVFDYWEAVSNLQRAVGTDEV